MTQAQRAKKYRENKKKTDKEIEEYFESLIKDSSEEDISDRELDECLGSYICDQDRNQDSAKQIYIIIEGIQ